MSKHCTRVSLLDRNTVYEPGCHRQVAQHPRYGTPGTYPVDVPGGENGVRNPVWDQGGKLPGRRSLSIHPEWTSGMIIPYTGGAR